MKVIVLTGLVSIEKAELTRQLAQHFSSDKWVAVIDNMARMPIDKFDESVTIRRIEDDVVSTLSDVLHKVRADVMVVAISEQVHPERLFVALDDLREQEADWEIYSLALIDTRTCDCFPNLREALERYADVSVMIPYQLDDVLAYVNHA